MGAAYTPAPSTHEVSDDVRGAKTWGEKPREQPEYGGRIGGASTISASGGAMPRDASRDADRAAAAAMLPARPPPLGDDPEAEQAVDAMVFNLKQRFKQSGVTLPLEKQSGPVFRLGSRKLQLSIKNGRLTVRVGQNYIDFLEYLSKAAL